MRKTLFILTAVTFITSLCFAQQEPGKAPGSQKPEESVAPAAPVPVDPTQAAPSNQPAQAPLETKIITGKVDSVLIGDLSKGVKSELVVVNEAGQKLDLAVRSGISILAKDGKMLTLNGIKNGDKVMVEYITKESGVHRAISIKLVE